MVDFKPPGYTTMSPYVVVDGPRRVMDFTRTVFDAEEIECITLPDGTVMHSEVRIGDTMLMLGQTSQGMPALIGALYVYVADVDATYRKALDAGAESTQEPMEMFWGDRYCGFKDASGIQWWVATHVEDVPADEIQRRMAEQFGGS